MYKRAIMLLLEELIKIDKALKKPKLDHWEKRKLTVKGVAIKKAINNLLYSNN